jgi:hypothetical protein
LIAPRRFPAIVVALLLSGCGNLGDEVAIRVGDRHVTLEDLRIAYANLEPTNRPPLATAEQRMAFAKRVVERMLLAEEGRARLADSAETSLDRARERDTILLRRLRVLETGSAGTDSSEAAAAYGRMRVRHRIQSVAFPGEPEARAARERIDRGEPFEGLRTREIGAAPEPEVWIAWQPQPDPFADAVADAEPGTVVGPMRARGRWLLVRVVEREPHDPGSFEDVRVRIHQGLQSRRELEAIEKLVERLRAESDLRVDEDAVARIVARTREAILQPGATEHHENWAIPELTAAEDSLRLAEWRGGFLTCADYVRVLREDSRGQRPRSALDAEVKRTIQQEMNARLLTAEAERRGLARDRWVLRALERFEEERAVQRGIGEISRIVDPLPPPDSLALLLESTRPDLFLPQPKARILRIDLPSREAGLAERAAIRRAGGPAARLLEILDGSLLPEGPYHLLSATRNDLPPAAAVDLFEGGAGAVTGPHALGGSWVVLGCLEVREAEARTQAEILAEVAPHLNPGGDASHVAEWIARREKELGVTIDEKVLDSLTPGG